MGSAVDIRPTTLWNVDDGSLAMTGFAGNPFRVAADGSIFVATERSVCRLDPPTQRVAASSRHCAAGPDAVCVRQSTAPARVWPSSVYAMLTVPMLWCEVGKLA